MTLSCRLGLLCSHLFFREGRSSKLLFFFFSWKLLREQKGVFRWSWGAFGKAGGSDNLSPERISDNSNIARYGSVYEWLLVWNLQWFWSAVLLICSVTAGPMFSNEWQKKSILFRAASVCTLDWRIIPVLLILFFFLNVSHISTDQSSIHVGFGLTSSSELCLEPGFYPKKIKKSSNSCSHSCRNIHSQVFLSRRPFG